MPGLTEYAKLARMVCPLCRQRPARRLCPALGREICPHCCGTGRQVDIHCTPDCRYLAAAEAHPPAATRRRQERDAGFVLAMREGLTELQGDILMALLGLVADVQGDPLLKPTDEDVAEAAAALAATYETADKGLIYEHRPSSLLAQRLVTDIRTFLAGLAAEADAAAARRLERDSAVALRHLEAGARGARKVFDDGPATALGMIGGFVAAGRRQRRREPAVAAAESDKPLLVKP